MTDNDPRSDLGSCFMRQRAMRGWLSVVIVVVALSVSAKEVQTQDARTIEAADNLDIMIASEPDSPGMQAFRKLIATDPKALVIIEF